ncbi:MAG: hypothetical protein QXI12_07315 [Candidatus Methanomethyliaceae archaeon]
MKRIMLLALMVMGLVALAADEVPTDSQFTIPQKYDFEYSGNVLFPATSDVGKPDSVGWFETNEMNITFKTNYNLTIGLYQSAFHGPKTLPTQAGGWGTLFAGWLDPWKDIVHPYKYWVATKSFGPGVYSGTFKLQVYRDGFNDPAGTYISDCFLAIYEG